MNQSPRSISLGQLIQSLAAAGEIRRMEGCAADEQRAIVRITDDSREATADSLFVAIRGRTVDGHTFISRAIENGARAIVCEQMPDRADQHSDVTYLEVGRARRSLAVLADAFYGSPAKELTLIGITGTNGKTTTASLIYHALKEIGISTGIIGTIETRIGDETAPSELTTPGPMKLNELLRQMVDAGCAACVMEVSSHALDQHRVQPEQFNVGVFTNLSHDHLDYHGSFDAYRQVKKKLFDALPAEGTAVYNADDSVGEAMVTDTAADTVSYGLAREADLSAEVLDGGLTGLWLRINGQEIQSPLAGRFNAYNLLAAYGACRAITTAPEKEVLHALASVPPVPGRLERFSFADGTVVFVDYAHTPDALENALRTLASTKPPDVDLWCVVGCGGDRDRTKRPMMGAVAERWADRVVLTSDNPRSEDPEAILDDIRGGFNHPENVAAIVDRREAIQQVAQSAAAGDVVLVAGKGHETYQLQGTERLPFDDREEVKHWFAAYSRLPA